MNDRLRRVSSTNGDFFCLLPWEVFALNPFPIGPLTAVSQLDYVLIDLLVPPTLLFRENVFFLVLFSYSVGYTILAVLNKTE